MSTLDPAHRLGLSRSTVSNLLRAMDSAGLVTRPSAEDGRRVRIAISDKALDLFERFDRAGAALLAEAAATLSTWDRAALACAVQALERLRDAITAQRLAAHDSAKSRGSAKPRESRISRKDGP